ncbi:class I SAM-dependent methyltransferase [Streptomyces parvus]
MLDYDDEARHYDATRGGETRARAAADAVERLLPQGPCAVLDIACGTGIVTERLLRPERTVVGVDRSPGMLGLAARRLCAYTPRVPDRSARVLDRAAELGLRMAGRTVFPGTGQGRSPRGWREAIDAGHISWCTHAPQDRVAEVRRRLSALPGQDTARPDPRYRLVALKS